MTNKKNDWIATLMFQPEATLNDFYANNISPDNTTIQSQDYYKNIPQIQETFVKEDGTFDENQFNDFYNQSLQLYNVFASTDYNDKILDTFEYDPWDSASGWGNDRKDMSASIKLAPLGSQFETHGIQSIGLSKPSDWSLEEIAQTQKVVDSETGNELDWSPNEKGGLFKSLFRPSIVYATWDEDGTHELNGRVFEHKKGDWKLNKNGLPYTELAGNRELYDKTFVNISDTLTKETSKINKYDFFDSDGLDKSVGGTIAKTVLSIAPYFIPGVNTAFGAISASLILAQVLPTFAKGVTGMFTDDDSELNKTLTQLENYTSRFKGDVSDASKRSLVTFENFGNLIADVSSQLFQQQVVGMIPKLFTKNNAAARKIGSKLALGYMAATSGKDAYAQFKNAGADDVTAGLGMLGTMTGLYLLMNHNYFRSFAAKGSFWDDSVVKDATRSVVQDWKKGLFGAPVKDKKTAETFLQRVTQKFSKTGLEEFKDGTKRFVTQNSFWRSAINESLEETSEEAVADIMKGLTAGLNALGFNVTEDNKALDFGFSTKDFLQRYAMAFAGGFIGGPIFELHHRWDATLQKHLHGVMPKELSEEFVYLIRNKRTGEILETLNNWHKEGKLADPNLSGKNTKTIVNADGKTEEVWEAAKPNESQNDLVYNVLTSYVNALDKILSNEGLKLTDEDVKAVLNKDGELIDDPIVNKVLKRGLDTAILQDWNSLSDQIIKVSTDLDAKLKELSEGKPTSTAEEREIIAKSNKEHPDVIELQSKLEALRIAKNNILSGNRTKYYIGQGLFVLDDETNNHFVNLTLENYTKIKYNKTFNSLSESQQKSIREEHAEYMRTVGSQNLKKAYDYYLDFAQRNAQEITALNATEAHITTGNGYLEKTIGQKWIENGIQIALKNVELNSLSEETEDYENKKNAILEQIEVLNQENRSYVQNGLSPFILNELDPESGFQRLRDLTIDALSTPVSTQKEIDVTAQKLFEFYNTAGILKTSDSFKKEANQFLKSAIEPLTEIWYYSPIIRWTEENKQELNDAEFDVDSLQALTQSISEVEINIGKNNKLAIKSYQQFELQKQQLIQSLQDIIDAYGDDVPGVLIELKNRIENANISINGKPLSDFIVEIDSFTENAVQSPIKYFLDQIALQINGRSTNLIDMIENEERTLISKRNIEDYVIESPVVEQEFEEATQLLHVVEALINGGYNGLNHAINSVPGETILPLGELTENASKVVNGYFNNIKQRLMVLRTIHEMNKGAALNIQKDIAVVTNKNQIKFFANEFDVLKIAETLQLGDDWSSKVNAILSKYNVILDQLDESTFSDLEQARVEIESLLYETVDFKNISNKEEFAKKFVGLFGKDLWKLNTGKFTTQSQLTDYSKMIYLFSIISVDPKQFYAKYKRLTSDSDFRFAPISAQEFLIRTGYATYLNPVFASIINQEVAKLAPDDKPFVKSRSILNNLFVILGGAGTGKTTCCDYILTKMITEDRSKIFAVAPNTTLVDKLAEDIDTSNKLTRDQLLDYVYGENYLPEYVKSNTNHILSNSKPQFKDLPTAGAIVVIDEATFYSESELVDISNWASSKGYFIICSGDLKQNGQIIKYKDTDDKIRFGFSGLEDTVFISGPELATSLRADNQASYRNAMKLDGFLYDAWTKVKEDGLSFEAGFNYVRSTIGSNLELVYSETANGLYGEKLIKSDNWEQALSQLQSYPQQNNEPNKTIVVIADETTSSKWQNIPGITVLLPEQVQGSDFTYAIIDLANITNSHPTDVFGALRNLYTLTQRSRRGTIILDYGTNSWSDLLKLNTKEIVEGASPLRLTTESIEGFKLFRNESLDKITTIEEVDLTPISFNVKHTTPIPTPQTNPTPTPQPEVTPIPEPTPESTPEVAPTRTPVTPKQTPSISKEEEKVRKEVNVKVGYKYSLNFGKGYFLEIIKTHPELLKFTKVFGEQNIQWLLTISDLVFNTGDLAKVKTKLQDWKREGRIAENSEIGKMLSATDVQFGLRFNRQKDGAFLSLQLFSPSLNQTIKLPIGFSAGNYLDGMLSDFEIKDKFGLRIVKSSTQNEGRQSLSDFEQTTGTKFLDFVIFRDLKDTTNDKQTNWAETSNGKVFGILTDDLTLDKSVVQDFLNTTDPDESFITKHPNLTLVGLQRKNVFKTFIEYCNEFIKAKNNTLTSFIKVYKNVFGEDAVLPYTAKNLWEQSGKLFPLNMEVADRLLAKIILTWSEEPVVKMIMSSRNSDKNKYTFKLGDIELQFIFEPDPNTGGVYKVINDPKITNTFTTFTEIAQLIQKLNPDTSIDKLQLTISSLTKKGTWFSDRMSIFNDLFTYNLTNPQRGKNVVNTTFVDMVSTTIPHVNELNIIDKVKSYSSTTNWLPIANFDKSTYSVVGQTSHSIKTIEFTMTEGSTTLEVEKRLEDAVKQVSDNAAKKVKNVVNETKNVDAAINKANEILERNGQTEKIVKNSEAVGESEFVIKQKTLQEKAESQIKQSLSIRHKKDVKDWKLVASRTSGDWKIGLVYVTLNDDSVKYYVYNSNGKTILTPTQAGEAFRLAWNAHTGENKNAAVQHFLQACLVSSMMTDEIVNNYLMSTNKNESLVNEFLKVQLENHEC